MGSETTLAPHVLLVSFPAQGHVNPLLRLAKRLASKGLLVTFSSTNSIGDRITSSTKSKPETLIPIGKGHLRFEFFSDGWEDVDVNDPRRLNLSLLMHQLLTVCSVELGHLIRRHSDLGSPISCVINNPFVPWVLDVAHSFSIPSACLWVQSSSVFSIYYHYFHNTVPFPTESNPDVLVQLPGTPPLTADELPTFLLESNPYVELREVILSQFSNIEKATWVFANTFEELERESIAAISAMVPFIAVGPLLDGAKSKHVRGDLFKAEDCVDWLNGKETGSVVYISLGSIVDLTKEEMGEMAEGLLNCGQPFLWVVRESSRSLLPDGFIEEAESCGRGKIVSWSPQEEVLSHSAVGSFVTHCGWNSTLEALAAGVTVVTYPQWGDQVPDSKFLVDVYEVGVRLKSPMKKEELQRCVEEVMRGEKAEKLKGNALKWKEAAGKAVAEGGSSDRNIQAFVDEILKRRRL